jgi:primosomal protein N' (replication factor Y)
MPPLADSVNTNNPAGAAGGETGRVSVLLPLPLPGLLDYAVAADMQGDVPQAGQFVAVTLSGKPRIGVVWDESSPLQAEKRQVASGKLKPVDEILDLPPLREANRRFIEWVADYTLTLPGAILRMTMSTPGALGPPPVKTLYSIGGPPPARMTPARKAVLQHMEDQAPASAQDIAAAAGVGEGVVRGLAKAGTLLAVSKSVDQPFAVPDPDCAGPELTEAQTTAAGVITDLVGKGGFQTILLDGVTGSGKTEVYLEGVAEVLRSEQGQVLVLLPEIALTAQWLGRFEKRFGVRPVEWHSELGSAGRRRAWTAVQNGHARVVVGARSALFLPFPNLSLIVVDEEHDASFKQEEGVLYNARDMAIARAMLEEHVIVLASATPALETVANAQSGKYIHCHLGERFGGASMPEIQLIDMREEVLPAGRWLSAVLERAIADNLQRGEQTMLFLNRRGYAPLTLCRKCGERIECPNCSAWLVEHRYRAELMCHHCGHAMGLPRECPTCGGEDTLAPCGPGVERLEEEVRGLFPEARLLVMTSDTTHGPAHMAEQVALIEAGEVDIIIGTQIVTKGYHFPNLTLVGVVDADLGFKGADLRAGERTYQQLAQVAGRAGREERPGRALLQTYMPEHPVTQALLAGDRDAFVNRELAQRRSQAMPPFGRLAAILVTGRELNQVVAAARALARSAPQTQGVRVLGPAPAPLSRLRGNHRYRLLVNAPKGYPIQQLIREWLARAGSARGVRVKVDIDPYSFL